MTLGTTAAPHTGPAPEDRSRPPAVRRATAAVAAAVRRPGLLVSALVVALMLAWAVVPGWFTSADPLRAVPAQRLSPPSASHPFGTDNVGRDVYARVVHGAALSMEATLVAVSIALLTGALIGLTAGYAGGATESLIMRGVDVLLAIPALLLSLMIVTVLGFGTINVAVAVGLASAGTFARVMRAEVVRIRSWAFVEASAGLGSRWPKILLRRVLPNAVGPVLAMAAVELGSAILSVAALSFLGFGAQPPLPEWGQMIAEGRNFMVTAWWLTTLPGLVVIALVVAVSTIGRTLRRRAS